jgi:hypothetical protein
MIEILVVGLVFSLILPVGSSYCLTNDATPTHPAEPPLEITIRGGLGIHVDIQNTGTTDVHVSEMNLKLDGARIKWNTDTCNFTIGAGKTKHVIYVTIGFGATNIDLTVDTMTKTASGKALLYFVYGVE